MATTPHPKTANPDHDILDVIRARWSPRAFDAAREISAADLWRLFEAARWAPSSLNEQPWRFVVADRRRSPVAFAAQVATLTERNQAWASQAPILVIAAVKMTLERTGQMNRHAWYDAGQAVAFLTLQATAIGLSIRQMEGFDHTLARAACGMPDTFEPAVVMAIGYEGDPDALTLERHRDQERQPRTRRKIDEFVFDGAWDRLLGTR